MACKIAVIGAGGACFVTGFVKDICESKYLDGSTLALMDINEQKLMEAKGVAEKLGLRNYHVGHGGSGVVNPACSGVPKAIDFYEYCFDGIKVSYPHPDYILLNYGANDQGQPEDIYVKEYEKLLRLVRKVHPE